LSPEVTKEDAERAIKLQEDCMKQVGYDPDTGKVDIDKVEGRTSKSERDKINIIIDVIKELCEDYEGSAPKTTVYAELADKYNVGEAKVDEVINMLKTKGVIYEPTPDHYNIA